MTKLSILLVINQAFICVPSGPTYTDGDLQTFTEVECFKSPLSEKSMSCMKDELVSIENVYGIKHNENITEILDAVEQ